MALITAEEIRNIEFTKSMGGYKTTEVDPFIDRCADTVEALEAEKEALNKKLSLLADKLVEYRKEEDSIREAILSAQRMGKKTVTEAETQAEEALSKASREAEEIVAAAKREAEELLVQARGDAEIVATKSRQDIRQIELETSRIKQEANDFTDRLFDLYKEHLAKIKEIQELAPEAETVSAPAEAAAEPAAPEAPAEPAPEAPAEPAPETPAEPAPAPAEEEAPAPQTVMQEYTPQVQEQKPSRFSDLKFGDDYDISEDDDEIEEEENGGFFGRRRK